MNPELDFEKRYRLVREVIETVVLTILMFLIIRFAVQNFNIEGTSMEPRLHDKELILVDKWTYLFRPPTRGDVIVFVAPPAPSQDYIKRVIAIPGDTLTIINTTVIVDGVTLNETYVDPARQGNPYADKVIKNLVIPPNDYFVMGDNRAGSSDSRAWGFVPRQNIIGRAALVYWPLGQNNNGFLPNYSSVFNTVHQPGQGSVQNDVATESIDAMLLIGVPGAFVVLVSRRHLRRRKAQVRLGDTVTVGQGDEKNETG